MNDTSIIALFQRRSEAALSELMRQYGRLLRQLARNILPTEEDAEECVNDAVLDVWNSIPASAASFPVRLCLLPGAQPGAGSPPLSHRRKTGRGC